MSTEQRNRLRRKIRSAIQKSPYKSSIKKASLFGSYAYGTPKATSDVDLLVEFTPQTSIGYFELVDIKDSLGREIGKEVDLSTPDSLSEYFRTEVLKLAQPVYETR